MSRVVVVGGSDAGISAALRDPRTRPGQRGRRRPRRRLPQLLDLRNPLLHLGRRSGLARSRPPHRRRPRSNRDDGCAWTRSRGGSTSSAASYIVTDIAGREDTIGYDKLVIGTGAVSVRPRIDGLTGRRCARHRRRRPPAPFDGRHVRGHAHARGTLARERADRRRRLHRARDGRSAHRSEASRSPRWNSYPRSSRPSIPSSARSSTPSSPLTASRC